MADDVRRERRASHKPLALPGSAPTTDQDETADRAREVHSPGSEAGNQTISPVTGP